MGALNVLSYSLALSQLQSLIIWKPPHGERSIKLLLLNYCYHFAFSEKCSKIAMLLVIYFVTRQICLFKWLFIISKNCFISTQSNVSTKVKLPLPCVTKRWFLLFSLQKQFKVRFFKQCQLLNRFNRHIVSVSKIFKNTRHSFSNALEVAFYSDRSSIHL